MLRKHVTIWKFSKLLGGYVSFLINFWKMKQEGFGSDPGHRRENKNYQVKSSVTAPAMMVDVKEENGVVKVFLGSVALSSAAKESFEVLKHFMKSLSLMTYALCSKALGGHGPIRQGYIEGSTSCHQPPLYSNRQIAKRSTSEHNRLNV